MISFYFPVNSRKDGLTPWLKHLSIFDNAIYYKLRRSLQIAKGRMFCEKSFNYRNYIKYAFWFQFINWAHKPRKLHCFYLSFFIYRLFRTTLMLMVESAYKMTFEWHSPPLLFRLVESASEKWSQVCTRFSYKNSPYFSYGSL